MPDFSSIKVNPMLFRGLAGALLRAIDAGSTKTSAICLGFALGAGIGFGSASFGGVGFATAGELWVFI
jgi:hypothetical protein